MRINSKNRDVDPVGHSALNAEHLVISLYCCLERLNIAVYVEKLELTHLLSENLKIYMTYHHMHSVGS